MAQYEDVNVVKLSNSQLPKLKSATNMQLE